MSYDKEFELFLQKRVNDNYVQNGPPPKRNKKKSKAKDIAIIILYILGGFAIGTGIAFGIYYIVKASLNNSNDNNETLLAPNTDLSDVKNSNTILTDSTYSVSLKYYDGLSIYASYGTAWSYGFHDNSWYLLTNFHVVRDYLYYSNAHNSLGTISSPYKINEINTFDLKKYNGNKLSSIMNNFDSNINDSINEYSVSIISDNNNDSINLFSEGNSNSPNFYSLDMAMIEIKDLSNRNQIKSYIDSNNINLPFNDWLKNQNNLISNLNNIDSYLIGGFPVFGNQPDKYYFETNLKKDNLYLEANFWNNKIYPNVSASGINGVSNTPSSYKIKQRGNVIVSNLPFEEGKDDDKWNLISGASGSPVFPISRIIDNQIEINNIPIGIYWGGLTSSSDKDLIEPGFTAFISNTSGCKYNIYENFKAYINIS